MTQTPGSPIDYPTVKVGDSTYQMKFTLTALVKLDSWGISHTIFRDWLKTRSLSLTYSLAAAALGTVDEQGQWKSSSMTRDELTDILDNHPDHIPGIVKGIVEAMGKRSAALESKKAEAGPAPVSQPAQ